MITIKYIVFSVLLITITGIANAQYVYTDSLKKGEMAFAARNDTVEQIFIIRKLTTHKLTFYYRVVNIKTKEYAEVGGIAKEPNNFGNAEDAADPCLNNMRGNGSYPAIPYDYRKGTLVILIKVSWEYDRVNIWAENKHEGANTLLLQNPFGPLRRTPLPLLH